MLSPSLLTGENAAFLDEQYNLWLTSPDSVDASWRAFFDGMRDGSVDEGAFVPAAPDRRSIFASASSSVAVDASSALRIAVRQTAVVQYINAWRVRGHFRADVDPLGRQAKRVHPEITIEHYGLNDGDLDARVPTAPMYGMSAVATIRQIRERLAMVYGGSIGAEFMNIDDLDQKHWVLKRLEELPDQQVLTVEEERRILRKLADAESFEQMLHTRFPGTKRFSLEGGETLIPLLDLLITRGRRNGVREIVIGMPHRGRLNVLANTLEKPVRAIVEEFQDFRMPTQGTGDVKYHLGYSSDVQTVDGETVHLSLTPNPSHLEAVNAVVEGRVRAKQDLNSDLHRDFAMAVLMHGDAAFIGQGSVAETLQLSELAGYRTGGTLHLIVNNQIGFTTDTRDARSTPYATDVARMLGVPIFHVNGEDPRAVAAVVQIALDWRQTFHRDVVIDMYCYRKHGHNEGDEPSFTQPLMYEQIRARPTPRLKYAARLVAAGRISAAEAESIGVEARAAMDAEASQPLAPEAKHPTMKKGGDETSPLRGRWARWLGGHPDDLVPTQVPRATLQHLLERVNRIPEGFTPHTKVRRLIENRLEIARGERPVDWAMAEQAAFASLVVEGHPVRLSGQDSGRGTFSHRHAVWTDVNNGAEHYPLRGIADNQEQVWVIDSSLSEFAVLAFEYGYTLDTPETLVLWEAQFGDFANGAQVIVDQFLASTEQKWNRHSGLVMLLPHGYEGQGPEHSSARLERFLLLCAQDNLQVANCTTPANYFHLLRRQVIRKLRKPLVLMSPKSLLRSERCVSTLDDLASGSFQPVFPDVRNPDPTGVERVVLCSGHVYYDLAAALEAMPPAEQAKVAVVRVEMLYPFPAEALRYILGPYTGAELVWCQEEPKNMGAWPVIATWIRDELPGGEAVRYVGRSDSASPATGSHAVHKREQTTLVQDALNISPAGN